MTVENEYQTSDDEYCALEATYAALALKAIWRYSADNLLGIPSTDTWAMKVWDLLSDTQDKLRAMADEELRFRPNLLEAGKARDAAEDAERKVLAALEIGR